MHLTFCTMFSPGLSSRRKSVGELQSSVVETAAKRIDLINKFNKAITLKRSVFAVSTLKIKLSAVVFLLLLGKNC